MQVKVCGLRDPENIAAVAALRPDMVGFIFYEASPRYAGNISPAVMSRLPAQIRKVGVFVNAGRDFIRKTAEKYQLDMLQLHGDESPDTCYQLKRDGLQLIKAFGIRTAADLLKTVDYESVCDLFLFDTRSKSYGGTGKSFDWEVLKHYTGAKPFLLSGGISANDGGRLRELIHPEFAGIDLNSRFEISPGLKDIHLLTHFLKEL